MKKAFTKALAAIAAIFTLSLALGIAAYAQDTNTNPEAGEGVSVALSPAEAPANALYYSDFGAKGDGVTDDFDAIIATHKAANEQSLPVAADLGATYYMNCNSAKTAEIQTSTYWGNAKFILDDTDITTREMALVRTFKVTSKLAPVPVTAIGRIAKNQAKLDLNLARESLVMAYDDTTIRFIRNGSGLTNDGERQTDVFLVDKDGNVDPGTPVLWDYDTVTSMVAYPIDAEPLTLSGGRFTTIAGKALSNQVGYFYKGIHVTRSNVVIDSIYHDVTGETKEDVRYSAFVFIEYCANVMVRNSMFSGRRAGGNSSYDLVIDKSCDVTFYKCKQITSIHDESGAREFWGIMSSNYVKNLTYDTVEFSRYDSHKGVYNATIKNSIIGYQGLALIGSGTALVENTKIYSYHLVNLRDDYGSTWDGEFVVRNCEFFPTGIGDGPPVVFNGTANETHDYGYTCYMPRKITIDGLVIHDGKDRGFFYCGPRLFGTFMSPYVADWFKKAPYPYVRTKEVAIRNLEIESGRGLVLSDNILWFRRRLLPTVKVRA
ncbi:MAG: right-handed parallel beta-helix repeat-containing protein [Oscillospiraceae bacterium]|nr:right-handed parallel beta-helix repeat-containing protein [Oscillospiraceae bacterium]